MSNATRARWRRIGARERLVEAIRGPVGGALAASFTLDLLTALIVFAFSSSYLVRVLHAPDSYPAYALGVFGFVKLVSSPPGGWLADHVRGEVAAAVAVALQVGGIVLMLLTGTGEGYIAGMAPLAAGSTLAWLLIFRALGEHVDAGRRAEASAQMTVIASAGLGVGFAVAALVAEHQEQRTGFYAGLIVAAIMAPPLIRASVGLQVPEHLRETQLGWRAFLSGRAEAIAAAVTLTHFIAFSGIVVVLGPYALDRLGLTLAQVGVVAFPGAAAAAVSLWLAGKRSRHGRRLWEVGLLYLLGGVAMAIPAAADGAGVFAVAMVLLGISLGGSSPLLSAIRIDVSLMSERPGLVLGRLSFADGVGAAAGPFLAGFAIELAGVHMGMVTVAAAFVVTGLLSCAGTRLVRL